MSFSLVDVDLCVCGIIHDACVVRNTINKFNELPQYEYIDCDINVILSMSQ